MKYILIFVCFLLVGCAHKHDVSSHFSHDPENIDALVKHMDDKITALECRVYNKDEACEASDSRVEDRLDRLESFHP